MCKCTVMQENKKTPKQKTLGETPMVNHIGETPMVTHIGESPFMLIVCSNLFPKKFQFLILERIQKAD